MWRRSRLQKRKKVRCNAQWKTSWNLVEKCENALRGKKGWRWVEVESGAKYSCDDNCADNKPLQIC